MKKSVVIAGVLAILLGAGAIAGCGNRQAESGDPEAGTIALAVTEPQNEITVHQPGLAVRGQTEEDAVVTVNEAVVEVDDAGKFATTVTLEEGPNLIEVVASNFEGDESSVVLSVIYDVQLPG